MNEAVLSAAPVAHSVVSSRCEFATILRVPFCKFI